MTDCKNVIFSFVGYRRNIAHMPFVNKLTDNELAVGVARSLSEIFGEQFEFKSLKNLSFSACKELEEDGVISGKLIENKDISAYAVAYNESSYIYINEEDHIRFECRETGFNLESCFTRANKLDDAVLEKLEMAFDVNLGYLTANPQNVGTGIVVGALLFVPAIVYNKKAKIIKGLLNKYFEFVGLNGEAWNEMSPFVIIKNGYSFGLKENEYAEKLKTIIQKILEYEINEENNIFNLTSSTLVDKIFRSYGILKDAYRLELEECEIFLGDILWGINLNLFIKPKNFEILKLFSAVGPAHLDNGNNLNIKQQEKIRAIKLSEIISKQIHKGEVDV